MKFGLRSAILIALVFVLGTVTSTVVAQDEAKNESAATDSKAVPKEGKKVDVRKDAGIQAVQQAQAAPVAKYEASKTAEQQLEQFVQAKGWKIGWDSEKKRLFAVGVDAYNCEDPGYDSQFCIKREQIARRAILAAKSKIIRFISQEMSAADQLRSPGTDLNKKFGADIEALQDKLDAQRPKLVALLRDADKEAGAALEDAGIKELPDMVVAAVKTLDKHFAAASNDKGTADKDTKDKEVKEKDAKEKVSANKPDAATAAAYEKLRETCKEALMALNKLKQQASDEKSRVISQFTSELSVFAKMPLLGGTVIQQAESWNKSDKQYQVAVLVCWSNGLEEAARAALTGEPLIVDAPADKSETVQEWTRKQDIGAMVGPRQYVDGKGQRHFLGITARPVSRNVATDGENRDFAAEWAQQMTVFSLFADVDVTVAAKQMGTETTTSDPDTSALKVAESLSKVLGQRYEKMKIQGLAPVVETVVEHPLTGRKIHVAVYEISPENAQVAISAERANMLGAIHVLKDQAFRKGRAEALMEAVNNARNDKEAFQAGREQGEKDVKSADTKPGKKPDGGKTKEGSVIGGDVKDNF